MSNANLLFVFDGDIISITTAAYKRWLKMSRSTMTPLPMAGFGKPVGKYKNLINLDQVPDLNEGIRMEAFKLGL